MLRRNIDVYRTTANVSKIGHRVRKNDSLSGDDIGTIPHNSTVHIEKVVGDWGKLNCNMELQKNLYHVSYDGVTDGWVLLKNRNTTYFELGKAEGSPVNPTPYIIAVLAGTAVTGAAVGYLVVSGGFAAAGLSAKGPVAGGYFATNMGAALTAGSYMATAQTWAMNGASWKIAAGIGGIGGSYAYGANLYRRWMTG